MISPIEFSERWCEGDNLESLVVYAPKLLSDIIIPDESLVFLTTTGLPESAAPFLEFCAPEKGTLQMATEMWQLANEYNRYRIIGSNGSGDPVCIDEFNNGQIVYLNHDCYFHRILINSSVQHLAESLLAFRHFVHETRRRNGEDAYLDGNVPNDLQQWLVAELTRIDPVAVQTNCFWAHELDDVGDNATE